MWRVSQTNPFTIHDSKYSERNGEILGTKDKKGGAIISQFGAPLRSNSQNRLFFCIHQKLKKMPFFGSEVGNRFDEGSTKQSTKQQLSDQSVDFSSLKLDLAIRTQEDKKVTF